MPKYTSVLVQIKNNDMDNFTKLLNFTNKNNMEFVLFGDVSDVSKYINDNNEEYSENMILDLIKNNLLNSTNVTKQMLNKINMFCDQIDDRIREIEDEGDSNEEDYEDFKDKLKLFKSIF